MRSDILVLLSLLVAVQVSAAPSETDNDELAVFDRLGERERVLDVQRTASAELTRQRALLAYRHLRRRDLGFAANPEARLEDARAFDLALVALGRGSDETRALDRELERVRGERTALETALVTQTLRDLPADEEAATHRASDQGQPEAARLQRPVRGVPVAVPGSRRDGPTNIELRHDSLELLTRLDEPVHAIAAGVVKHVEALAQGGFAIVTAHPGGYTSIVTGLRDIAVKSGDPVDAGRTLGLAGRNLDGATVISVEIWRKRRPADAAKLLRVVL